ncbi:hypothetical protein Taro_044981 [Colocasia esculenta]|uniref:Uncharacterized protein n=1 Tax=Colocasia esculenta TaxID=4460 RepID=A0A843WVD8_COLES|nr:hypothetical protein [Colocasia esculenta]
MAVAWLSCYDVASHAISEFGFLIAQACTVLLECLVQAPNCCFGNPFLGAVCGGTGVCSSLTSWSARGAGWFCLWALDLMEVRDVGACVVRLWSHMVASVFRELLCLSGCVLRCCLRIVFDSAGFARVVFCPTQSHVVAPVFRELLCLSSCVVRCGFRIVFDSAGFAGVMFGPTQVVVEAFLYSAAL